jgi:hypothetical protein
MALTIDSIERSVFGNKRVVVANVDFDSSYPTGGEALAPSDFKLTKFDFVVAEPKSGYVFNFDYANNKLKVFQGDNDNAADAPLVEVANTTNLSTLTDVRLFAFGH